MYFCNRKIREQLFEKMAGSHTEERTNGENFKHRSRGISGQSCGNRRKAGFLTVSAFRHLRERWKMDRSGIPKVLQKF